MKDISPNKNIKKNQGNGKLFVKALLCFSLTLFAQLQYAQLRQLTLGDIFTGLRSKKVNLEERNKLLTEAIKARGITFVITSDIEKELQETGAAKELIEAIKAKSPIIKTAANPEPKPVSMPVSAPSSAPSLPDFSSFQKKGDGNFVKGEYDLAVVNYTKAIDLNPKEPSIYLSRGLVYYNRKFYELAIADYSRVLEIAPKEMMAYFYRGDSFEKLGEWQKAADDFRKVLELDSSNETAKVNLQRVEGEITKNKPSLPQKAASEPARERVKNDNSSGDALPTAEFAELGSLIGFAVKLVQPNYTQNLRGLRIEGEVMVTTTIDESGNPLTVKAVSGHPMLRQIAEEAVRRSKFKPTTVNDQPIKARGFVVFKFKAN